MLCRPAPSSWSLQSQKQQPSATSNLNLVFLKKQLVQSEVLRDTQRYLKEETCMSRTFGDLGLDLSMP